MSVEVQIPLRLMIDPALARRGLGSDVGQAVSDTVARAIAEMDREIIAPRNGYAEASFNAPEFSWAAGEAMPDADWRLGIEREVALGLRDAVARAPNSSAERLANAPEVVPANPRERFDPARLRGGGYSLPSYEGDIPSPEVPVTLQQYEQTPEWRRARMINLWGWHGSDDGLIRNIRTFLAHQPQGMVSTGTLGVLYVGPGPNGDAMRVAVVTVGSISESSVSASLVNSFVIGTGFEQFTVDLENRQEDGGGSVRESAVAEARIEKGRAIQGVADARAAFVENIVERVGVPNIEGMTADQVRQAIRDFATRQAEAFDPLHPEGFFARFILGSGSGGYACTIPRRSFSGSALRILPIYRLVERPAQGEESEGGAEAGGAGRRGEGQGGGGTGTTRRQGGGGGEGTGEAEGEGAGARRGSPLAEPTTAPGEGPTRFYPVGHGGEVVEIDLGPFEGEPSLEDLGEQGESLRRLMRRVAFRLEMPMGDYAGSFCIAAAQMVGIRAAAVAGFAESTPRATRPVEGGTGNLGDVEMPPSHSPAITVIRYIAGTVPILTRLQHLLIDIYNIPRIAAMITGFRESDPIGWGLDFYKSYTPKLQDSIGYLYIRTCQIKMLELLRNSAREIEARLTNFTTYYPVVRAMLLGLVASEARLQRLREHLVHARAERGEAGAKVSEIYHTWREVRHALTTSLSGQILNLSALTSPGSGPQGEIVETGDELRVRDEDGRLWSEDELDQAIAFRHGTAASIDPLIDQFRDIPEVVQTFRQSPTLSRVYLRALLNEMKSNNRDITSTVISDDMFAFRAGKIREDLPNRTIPYTDLSLQGIHLVAHEAIGDAFMGDRAYALGVQYVMDVEQGRQGLIAFAETVSVIALAVICPPASAALGAVYATIHYADAAEIQKLYGSLIDPELILNRVEVEFDLFMAELEVALSIIPEVGSLTRGGSTAVRTVSQRGLRAGVRILGRRARRELLVSVGRQIKTGIVRHVVREVLTDRGMALILPHLLGPVMLQIHREISVLSGRPVPPEAAGTPPVPEHLTESESELIRRLREYQEGERDESLPGAEDAP